MEETKNLPCIIYKPQWTKSIIRGIIYKRTSPENKCYIGQTLDETSRNYNWNDTKHRYAGIKINEAREKFGSENFKYEVLFEIRSFNREEVISILNEKEIYFIKLFDSFNNGYNSNTGGSASYLNSKVENKPVIQLSFGLKFVRYWDSIQLAAEYFNIRPIAIHQCCRRDEGRSFTAGYKWIYIEDYEKHKDNLEDFVLKPKCNRSGLIQMTKEGKYIRYWKVALDVEKELKLSLAHISDCCSGKRRQCGGFRWMYLSDWEKCDGKPEPIDFNNTKRVNKVVQFRLNGEFMKIWNSITDASKVFNICCDSIRNCCNKNNPQKISGPYRWMYYKDYVGLGKKNLDPLEDSYSLSVTRRILQLSIEDNTIINIWRTASEIKKAFNINSDGFLMKLNNNRSGYLRGGYIWRFESDYIEERLGLDPKTLNQEKNL